MRSIYIKRYTESITVITVTILTSFSVTIFRLGIESECHSTSVQNEQKGLYLMTMIVILRGELLQKFRNPEFWAKKRDQIKIYYFFLFSFF